MNVTEKRDFSEVLEINFLGDWDLFLQVTEAFKQSLPKMMTTLVDAIKANENAKASEIAHKIKGSIAHFHHIDPVTTARRIEEEGKGLSQNQLYALYSTLEMQLNTLMLDLDVLAKQGSKAA
jgi:Hpt domain.